MKNHLYSVTVSNLSHYNLGLILRTALPMKYFQAFADASLFATIECDSCRPLDSNRGSGEIFFEMNHVRANALRKWFQRRYKGRSKFARRIVTTNFNAVSHVSV